MKDAGFEFDVAFTSVLKVRNIYVYLSIYLWFFLRGGDIYSKKNQETFFMASGVVTPTNFILGGGGGAWLQRAIKTLWLLLEDLGQEYIPVHRHWRLNERHYGALQGLNKAETAAKHGEEQVKIWRRSYDTPPPPLEESDNRHPRHDLRYAKVSQGVLPNSECLQDTVERFLPFWHDEIVPAIISGKRVIVAAHGNSLRALVKYLDSISDADIAGLNIPTAMPLVYELDDNLKPIKHYYLGDQDKVNAAMAAVANQGKAKQ